MIDPALVSGLSALMFVIGLGWSFHSKERHHRLDVHRVDAERRQHAVCRSSGPPR